MAKLVTTKEKYGVSVAARIDPELAHQISERAERIDVSFAKMLAMLISRGFNPQEPIVIDRSDEIDELEDRIEGLEQQLEFSQSYYREAAAELIGRIGVDDDDKLRFVEIYNEILTDKSYDNESDQ